MNKQYLIKVYPIGLGREVYRNIEISGEDTLDRLCQIILESLILQMNISMNFVWIIECTKNITISLIRKRMNLQQK